MGHLELTLRQSEQSVSQLWGILAVALSSGHGSDDPIINGRSIAGEKGLAHVSPDSNGTWQLRFAVQEDEIMHDALPPLGELVHGSLVKIRSEHIRY